MRRGTTVGEADPKTATKHELAELMVGSELPSPETEESTVTDQVLLELRGVTLVDERGTPRSSATSASRSTRARCSAIAGVEGNGQAELVEAIMGMRKATRHDHPGRPGHRPLVHPPPA